MEKIFTDIYEKSLWGENNSKHYKGSSGYGSSVAYNKDTYIPFLRQFITERKIKSIVDLGCGDFMFSPMIYDKFEDITYYGYDIYEKVIINNRNNHSATAKYNFIHLDFCNKKEEIVGGDLCILKDVIQHWPLNEIYTFLDYLVESKKFKYILICNCGKQIKDDTDITAGEYRHLSCDFFPLKKYGARKLYNYDTKEVSVIEIMPNVEAKI